MEKLAQAGLKGLTVLSVLHGFPLIHIFAEFATL